MPIEYVELEQIGAGIDPDSGQGLCWQNGCSNFGCQKWEGDTRLVPKLVADENGFRRCPVCRGSYGRAEVVEIQTTVVGIEMQGMGGCAPSPYVGLQIRGVVQDVTPLVILPVEGIPGG